MSKDVASALKQISEFLDASKRGETQPVGLIHWLKHDTWDFEEGLLLLLGLDPDGCVVEIDANVFGEDVERFRLARHLDGREVDLTSWEVEIAMAKKRNLSADEYSAINCTNETRVELDYLVDKYQELKRIWASGNHPQKNAPLYYLQWAKGKGFNVNWIDWAVKYQLIKPLQETPEKRKVRLKRRINELRVQGIKGFFKQTAKEEGISAQRLRAIVGDE